MNFYFSFALGSLVSGTSTGILVFCVLGLRNKGFGVEKEIDKIVIPGVIVNTIISVFCYIIFKNLALSHAGRADGSLAWEIGQIMIQLVGGVILGRILGTMGKYSKNLHIRLKMAVIMLLIFGILVFTYIKLILPPRPFAQEAYIIAVVTFSITIKKYWDCQQLDQHLGTILKVLSPIIFGTIGGDILLSKLDATDSAYGLVIIGAGAIGRIFTTVFCMKHNRKLNVKERIVMGFMFVPKAAL